MKVSSTPANSPAATLALVGSRHSAPTCCQSASVGEPMLTPGICRICERTSPCASTRVGQVPRAPSAAAAPMPAVPLRTLRRASCSRSSRSYTSVFIACPPDRVARTRRASASRHEGLRASRSKPIPANPSGSLVSTCDRRGLRVCGHLCKCQQIPEESVGGVQPSMIGSIRSGGVKPRTRRGWRFLVKGGFVFANRTSRGDLVDGRAHCPRSSFAARGALGGRRGEPKSHPPWHQLRLSDQRGACCARPRDGSTVTVLVGLSLRGKHARPAEAERA